MVSDSKTIEFQYLCERIKRSQSFYENNIAKKKSILNIFSEFLEAEHSESDYEVMETKACFVQQLVQQTRFLENGDLELVYEILHKRMTQESLCLFFAVLKQNLPRIQLALRLLQSMFNCPKNVQPLASNRLFVTALDLLEHQSFSKFEQPASLEQNPQIDSS